MDNGCKVKFWTKVMKVLVTVVVIISLFSCVMAFYFPALVSSVVALCMACGSGNPIPIAITMLVCAIVIGVPVYIIALELEKACKHS